MAMGTVLLFEYRDVDGVVTDRRVADFAAGALHFAGTDLDAGGPRTFRRDRVVAWTGGSEALLAAAPALTPFTLGARDHHAPGRPPDILFTGFAAADRLVLEIAARGAGLVVRGSVTEGLSYLCAGVNAGPAKISRARAVGAIVLERGGFEDYVVAAGRLASPTAKADT